MHQRISSCTAEKLRRCCVSPKAALLSAKRWPARGSRRTVSAAQSSLVKLLNRPCCCRLADNGHAPAKEPRVRKGCGKLLPGRWLRFGMALQNRSGPKSSCLACAAQYQRGLKAGEKRLPQPLKETLAVLSLSRVAHRCPGMAAGLQPFSHPQQIGACPDYRASAGREGEGRAQHALAAMSPFCPLQQRCWRCCCLTRLNTAAAGATGTRCAGDTRCGGATPSAPAAPATVAQQRDQPTTAAAMGIDSTRWLRRWCQSPCNSSNTGCGAA